MVRRHDKDDISRAIHPCSRQSETGEGVGQAVVVDVGGDDVAEVLDAVDGVAHGHAGAGSLEHGGVVVGVPYRDRVGDVVAERRGHVAHGGALVDAVDEQFAVVRRDPVVRAVHELEPGTQVAFGVLEGHVRVGAGEVRSLAHADHAAQRGSGRDLDLVDQVPEAREFAAVPRLALRLQVPAVPLGDVHAVRALPLVACDAVLAEVRHRRVHGLGRHEMAEQQSVADVRLRAGHGDHAVEAQIEDAALDLRHGSPGADEQLVAVPLSALARLARRIRHEVTLVRQRAVYVDEHQFACDHCALPSAIPSFRRLRRPMPPPQPPLPPPSPSEYTSPRSRSPDRGHGTATPRRRIRIRMAAPRFAAWVVRPTVLR